MKTKINKKLDENVCTTCWDIVYGPNRTKGAEYFNINHKTFCSLSCFYDHEKEQEAKSVEAKNKSNANKGNKGQNKVRPKKSKQKKRSAR